jgi:hypothetical protein
MQSGKTTNLTNHAFAIIVNRAHLFPILLSFRLDLLPVLLTLELDIYFHRRSKVEEGGHGGWMDGGAVMAIPLSTSSQ